MKVTNIGLCILCLLMFTQRWVLGQPSELRSLSSSASCNRCDGTFLPGKSVPHPETKWGIISDLPESFSGYGVLYSTREVLPANGGAPELLKQRRSGDFTSIDGGFDVFLFHLLKETTASARIVVFVKNVGDTPVRLRPQQIIKSEGTIGSVHEFESTLGRRLLAEEWDRPLGSVSIAPDEGRVVAFGKQFGAVQDDVDSSRNVNCFGYVRVKPTEHNPMNLEVSVVAIPAGPRERMESDAALFSQQGAHSTDEVGLSREPQGCALGRAVGTYRNFIWRSEPLVIDAAKLSTEGTSFPMALPAVQTRGCEQARQTQDLVLRPGYTREDTIGNYMIEYQVRFTLVNSGSEPVSVSPVFGKDSADIGLAYCIAVGGREPVKLPVDPVHSLWAGPKQSAREKPLLGKPFVSESISVPPGGTSNLALRFLICGNSSLPFMLGLKRTEQVSSSGK